MKDLGVGLLAVSGLLMLAGIGVLLYARYGPSPPVEPAKPRDVRAFFMESESMPQRKYIFPNHDRVEVDIVTDIPEDTTLDEVLEYLGQVTPPPTPRFPLYFDGLGLINGESTQFMFTFPGDDIIDDIVFILPKVDVYGWTPEIMGSGIFNPGTGNGVAWEDAELRTGLWLHSGLGETAGMLQQYLELNESHYRREIWTVDEFLNKNVIGAKVFIQQSDSIRNAKIVAAVRVPPDGVYEISSHVMDLVPYIIENYPEHGFEEIADRSDVLLLYFCGRQLTGEKAHPDLPTYQQSRFILAMVPRG